jgi:hypothetical protein
MADEQMAKDLIMAEVRRNTIATAEMTSRRSRSRAVATEPGHDAIASAAHLAWDHDGQPEGREAEYWKAAEAQHRANNSAAVPKARASRKKICAQAGEAGCCEQAS